MLVMQNVAGIICPFSITCPLRVTEILELVLVSWATGEEIPEDMQEISFTSSNSMNPV